MISKAYYDICDLEIENERNSLEYQALRIFFDDTSECLVMVDHNGYILMMNNTYANFLKIKQEQAIGKYVTDIIENTRLHIVIKTGKPEIEQIQWINGNAAVTSRIPIIKKGIIIGAVGKVIFKNSSEVNMLYKRIEETNRELNSYKERLRKVEGNYLALDNIVGNNSRILELKNTVRRVAYNNSTVLVTGESGTGKEIFANAIHELSSRKDNNYVKINCAAIPKNILESELFGYEEGAFTGARRGGKVGKFEMANKGTLFLDEIGDMDIDMQSKILRVLQDKVVERVGGNSPKEVDVRIIAATNKNLQEKIAKGEFREDLYYRLNVVPIALPSLRERLDDIPMLCDFFIEKFNKKFGIYIEKIDEDAMYHLTNYSWPGNIRELENVIERAYNFIEGDTIKKSHLPENILASDRQFLRGNLNDKLDKYEEEIITEALKNYEGNKSKTARMLGINRSCLYQKLKKYGIK